jgi:hypothetical protein
MALMPEGPPEAGGIRLWEAIERWTPKEVWQRYRQIAHEELPIMIFPPGPTPLQQEASRLRMQLERILTDKLCRGELIASGLDVPLDRDAHRWDIPSELWSRLKLDIGQEDASGDGLHIVELRFRTANEAEPEEAPAAVDELKLPPNKPAGRPSIMPMIEAEMRRRAASGSMEGSLGREVKVLATWAQKAFLDAHVPKPKSIATKLGRVYKGLKAINRPDK